MKLEEFLKGISVPQPKPSVSTLIATKAMDTEVLVERFNKALSDNNEVDLSAIGKTLFHRFHAKLKRTANVSESMQEIGNMLSIIYHKLH